MYNRQVVYRVIPWNFQSFGSEFATNLRREWAASRPRYNVTFRRPRVRSRVETWRTGEINEMSDLRANGNSNNCVHSRPRVSPDSSLKPVKSPFRILSAITRPIVPFPFSPALSRSADSSLIKRSNADSLDTRVSREIDDWAPFNWNFSNTKSTRNDTKAKMSGAFHPGGGDSCEIGINARWNGRERFIPATGNCASLTFNLLNGLTLIVGSSAVVWKSESFPIQSIKSIPGELKVLIMAEDVPRPFRSEVKNSTSN